MEIKILKESAQYFWSMCVEGYSVGVDGDGDWVTTPYSPLVKLFVSKHLPLYNTHAFAQFCRAVADRLDEEDKS